MMVDKSLLAGSTTMLVLKLLDGQDMYGYQIVQEIAARSGGTIGTAALPT